MAPARDDDEDSRALECPRCGYDLSGIVASWQGACPLVGVCSECGYEVEWASVFDPTRERLPWLYEHARSWWAPRAMLKTALLALLPWVFWRDLAPRFRVRLARAATVVFSFALAVQAFGLLFRLGTYVARTAMPGGSPAGTNANARIAPWYFQLRWSREGLSLQEGGELMLRMFAHPSILGMALMSAALLAATFGASSAWRRSRVRPSHLLRIFVYSLTPIAVLIAVRWAPMLWIDLASTFEEYRVRTQGLSAGAATPTATLLPMPPEWWRWFYIDHQTVRWLLVPALVWVMAFWFVALRRSLRIQNAWMIVVAGSVLGAIAQIALLAALGLLTGILAGFSYS